MARPRSATYDDQRDRILHAAVEAFSRIGYPSASMAQLAQSCGTSKAGLYHYFESKEALLFEALDRHTARLLSLIEDARARSAEGPERWAALVRGLMRAQLGLARTRFRHSTVATRSPRRIPSSTARCHAPTSCINSLTESTHTTSNPTSSARTIPSSGPVAPPPSR